MEPVAAALAPSRRQATLKEAMRRPGGIRVTEERELLTLHQRLQTYPGAAAAISETSHRLDPTVDAITVGDIDRG